MRFGRRPRAEQGSTLVLALVMVTLVAVLGVTVLQASATTLRATSTVTDKGATDRDARNAVTEAVAFLAQEPTRGRLGGAGECNSGAAAQLIGPSVENNDLQVRCSAAYPTGTPSVFPDATILTLGGRANLAANNTTVFCTTAPSDRTTAGGCESGLQVLGGDVRVTKNNDAQTRPLVQVNSSVYVTGADAKLTLDEGSPKARERCTDPAKVTKGAAACGGGGELTSRPNYTHGPIDFTKKNANTLADPATLCASGFVALEPGWYNDLVWLNDLMDACSGAVVWFTPGVYYFDFTTVPATSNTTQPFWKAGNNVHIVGGTLSGYTGASRENRRTMTFDAATVTGPWTKSGSAATPDAALSRVTADGDPEEGYLTRTLDTGGLATQAFAGSRWQLSPKAIDAQHPVTKLAINVRHGKYPEPDPAQTATMAKWYELISRVLAIWGGGTPFTPEQATAFADNVLMDRIFAVGYPRLEINRPDGGTCTVTLDRRRARLGTEAVTLIGGGVQDACPGTADNDWRTKTAPGLAANAAWINDLRVSYVAKAAAGATPPVSLDGASMDVEWTGSPSPAYPGGCDPTKPGVQFVFGDNARAKFVDKNMTVELCGQATDDTQPRIAVYGVDEKAAAVPATVAWPANGRWNDFRASNANWKGATADNRTGPWTISSWDKNGAPHFTLAIPPLREQGVDPNAVITGVNVTVDHSESLGVTPKVTLSPKGGKGANGESSVGGNITKVLTKCALASCAKTENVFPAPTNETDWQVGNPNGADPNAQPNKIRTVEAFDDGTFANGATLNYEVSGGDTNRSAQVNSIKVTVSYRNPGNERPLRGCTTVRTIAKPDKPANELAGTDAEWYPGVGTGAGIHTDSAYSDFDANDMERASCPLLGIRWAPSNAPLMRFHVDGVIFAPTAALDLMGEKNLAPLVTDGVIARHLTVSKWIADANHPEVCTFGQCESPTRDRAVLISIQSGGSELLRARVHFVDQAGNLTTTRITCMLARPVSMPITGDPPADEGNCAG